MAGRIPEQLLEDILGRVDIVELIGDSVSLKKAGRNFKACCPFHREKTASFMVSPDKQIYHCFGCHESGNAFKFLMRHERMEFREAVEYLARKAGVVLPEVPQERKRQAEAAADLYAVMEAAVEFYAGVLRSPEGEQARKYLDRRGITPETIDRLKLGAAPKSWDALLRHARSKQFPLALIEKAGLIMPRESGGYYDRFRDRVMFPIRDVRGRTIAFGARVLDDSLPKYMNSPETALYVKGRHFYGLDAAKDAIREADRVCVVEGYLDFVIPFQEGFRNIVASLGTALTTEQVRLLKRYTHNVVMIYDADDAGQAAALRSLDTFVEEEVIVRVASLPKGFDPDTFVRAQGEQKFRDLEAAAEDVFDFKLRMLRARTDDASPHGKAAIAAGMLETIARIKNAVLKSEYIRKLSRALKVEESALVTEAGRVKTSPVREEEASVTPPRSSRPVNPIEKLLVRLMLEEAGLINRVKDHLEPGDFQDDRVVKIIEKLLERADQGKSMDPSVLMESLQDAEIAQFVCESALDVDVVLPEHRAKVVDDCLRRLKEQGRKTRREELQRRIREADRSGDDEGVRRLMEEFKLLTERFKTRES